MKIVTLPLFCQRTDNGLERRILAAKVEGRGTSEEMDCQTRNKN